MVRGKLTLRQLQVLHRHGDRSPLANVFLGSSTQAVAEEVERWESRLPSQSALDALAEKYRLKQEAQAEQVPMQSFPFGFLTKKGIDQMKARGQELATFCKAEGLTLESLTDDDMQIYCNAYRRTQLSVQALLTGMLEHHEHLVPSVHVLPLDRDMIHTYSVYPEIAQLKIALEKESEVLIQRELELTKLKDEMLSLLPIFRTGGGQFYWTTCGDYYYCREAHDVPYLPGTEHLRDEVVNHKSFRFHQFYDHRRIRSLVAGQLMDHTMNEMNKLIAGDDNAKKIVVYSGHDVSILALLHAVDADITKPQTYWPPYSSTLAFELLEDEAQQWFVRVRMNGDVATLRGLPDAVPLDGFVDIVHDRIDFEE